MLDTGSCILDVAGYYFGLLLVGRCILAALLLIRWGIYGEFELVLMVYFAGLGWCCC